MLVTTFSNPIFTYSIAIPFSHITLVFYVHIHKNTACRGSFNHFLSARYSWWGSFIAKSRLYPNNVKMKDFTANVFLKIFRLCFDRIPVNSGFFHIDINIMICKKREKRFFLSRQKGNAKNNWSFKALSLTATTSADPNKYLLAGKDKQD